MVSIKDIAKKCGVNPATVSRALNGQKGVSGEMRRRILEASREMGYSRNLLAASLITSRTHMIGLIVPDITNPYYARMARGINNALEAQGYTILLCDTDRQRERELRYIEMLCNYHVDGVIISSVTAVEEDLEMFFRRGIRVMTVENPLGRRVSCVMNDNYLGASDLIEHLIGQGFKRLVAVMGRPGVMTTEGRLRGCLDGLKRHNMMKNLVGTFNINATYEGSLAVADEVFALKPDAIFAINDMAALGLMSYCDAHGIRVPEDVKIAGYDDISEASRVRVPLTTVHQHKYSLGTKAAEQLLYEMAHPECLPSQIALLPELKVRSSCGEQQNMPS